MDRAWLRSAQKLDFRDPARFLVNLRSLEAEISASDTPKKIKNLRTSELKEWRELREGAIFCHGMGQRIGQTVYIGKGESQDYDFVASWVVGGEQHLAPVQLKEVPPANLNPYSSLQDIVSALTKYVDSRDLTVAIHLNRQIRFDPDQIVTPSLKIAALWIFGALTSDQSIWGLWGNFLEEPQGLKFEYPIGN